MLCKLGPGHRTNTRAHRTNLTSLQQAHFECQGSSRGWLGLQKLACVTSAPLPHHIPSAFTFLTSPVPSSTPLLRFFDLPPVSAVSPGRPRGFLDFSSVASSNSFSISRMRVSHRRWSSYTRGTRGRVKRRVPDKETVGSNAQGVRGMGMTTILATYLTSW